MQRVSRSTAVPTMPAPPAGGTPGYFTGGNPGLGQAASVPGYEWFNAVQEELIGMIQRGGITPSAGDVAQVRKSLDRLFGGAYSFLNASTTLNIDQAGLIWVDASSTPITITLPLSAALNGRPLRYRIYKVGANAVTIQRQGSELINGLSTLIMAGPNDVADLMSTGDGSWVALSNISASSSNRGLTRYATVAETVAGSALDLSVTPAGLGAFLTGMIAFFPATAAPTGWIKANGALVSRATFFNLWAVAQASGNLVTDAAWVAANGPTGAFSQGDGSTTFRVPDLRGNFLRAWDDGRGVDAGRGIGTFQDDLIESHSHGVTITDPGHSHTLPGQTIASVSGFQGGTSFGYAGSTTNVATTGITASANNTGGAETRPRNIALLPCIKF